MHGRVYVVLIRHDRRYGPPLSNFTSVTPGIDADIQLVRHWPVLTDDCPS
jgi:hypothetical protein